MVIVLCIGCGSLKKPGDPGEFDGIFQLENDTEVIVFAIYEAYEIEFQMFGDPLQFYFVEKNESGNYVYSSDDKNLKFVMEPGHEKGIFYEINEPPLTLVKE